MRQISKQRQRGYVSLLASVSIVALAAFAGLAVDSGYMEVVRRRAQTAADSAALAAAFEMHRGDRDPKSHLAAARNDASLNGFNDGDGRTTVVVGNPPKTGRYAKNEDAVEAVVTHVVPTSFMMVLGQKSVTVTARAVARLDGVPRLAE